MRLKLAKPTYLRIRSSLNLADSKSANSETCKNRGEGDSGAEAKAKEANPTTLKPKKVRLCM
jgi:hypothetical protein